MSDIQYDLGSLFSEPVILPRVIRDTHTPARSIRVPDALWEAAQAAAEENGESVSDVVRKALEAYVKKNQRKRTGASER